MKFIKKTVLLALALSLVICTCVTDISAIGASSAQRYVPADDYGYGVNSLVTGSTIETISNATVTPYTAIAYIHADFPSCIQCRDNPLGDKRYKAATGFMISSTCMITCGHILRCEHGNDVENLRVYFNCPTFNSNVL